MSKAESGIDREGSTARTTAPASNPHAPDWHTCQRCGWQGLGEHTYCDGAPFGFAEAVERGDEIVAEAVGDMFQSLSEKLQQVSDVKPEYSHRGSEDSEMMPEPASVVLAVDPSWSTPESTSVASISEPLVAPTENKKQ